MFLKSQASFCKCAVPGWDFSSPSIGSHADCHWVGDDPKNYHGRQAGKSSQFYVLEYPSLLMHYLVLQPLSVTHIFCYHGDTPVENQKAALDCFNGSFKHSLE